MASHPFPSTSHKRGTRQVLAKDQWDELKPIIYQLYIREGKTFNKIQEIFAETYGFSPTLGQFKKRLTAWGFRKYGTTRRDGVGLTVGTEHKSDNSLNDTCVHDSTSKPESHHRATESKSVLLICSHSTLIKAA